jgi:ATP-dependent DNA helicase RecG
LRWDAEICKEATIEDVSVVKIRSFLKTAQLKYDSLENALKKLRIVHDGKLLNTAVMLFGKKPQSFFPNAKLRCAVFGTMDTSFPIDMKDFEGDLFYLIEKAEEYILKNIHIGMKIEGLKRIDIPEINQEAMREAIINAFCHRDYYEYDSVNIAIFKDRVEIRNPGLLYGGLTIEKIKTEMISERRNELIAELFHRVHYIEKWGRGIRLILSKEPDAEFKEVGTHFIVVFKRKEISASPSEGVSEGVDALFDYIKNNPGNRTPQFEEALSVPVKTIERWLKKLKDEQRIEFRGAPKTGGYYIKK